MLSMKNFFYKLALIVKDRLERYWLGLYIILVILAVFRSGPFFCEILPFCWRVSTNTFFVGTLLSIPVSTYFTVLAFWATALGLSTIVFSFVSRPIPDFFIKTLPEYVANNDSHYFKAPFTGPDMKLFGFTLQVINLGTAPILPDQVLCKLIFDEKITVLSPALRLMNHQEYPNKKVTDLSISEKIFPGRNKSCLTLDLAFKEPGVFTIEYYFITDHGYVPLDMQGDKNGEPFKNLGKLTIELTS